jgi:hypothetical protein
MRKYEQTIIILEHCWNKIRYTHNFGILHQSETLKMLKVQFCKDSLSDHDQIITTIAFAHTPEKEKDKQIRK